MEQSYGVAIQSKIQLTSTPRLQKVPKAPHECACLQRAFRSASHLSRLESPREFLVKKLYHLDVQWDKQMATLDEVLNVLSQKLTQCLKSLHVKMMKKWKGKVWLWSMSTGALHKYVRNDLPSPPLALSIDDRVTNHPVEVAQLPAASQTLLCPRDESSSFLTDWKRVCRWGITVLTRRRAELSPQENDGEQQEDPDPSSDPLPRHGDMSVKEGNGHEVMRFVRDASLPGKLVMRTFVLVKPCPKSLEPPLLEGDYCLRNDHVVRIDPGSVEIVFPKTQACVCKMWQGAMGDSTV